MSPSLGISILKTTGVIVRFKGQLVYHSASLFHGQKEGRAGGRELGRKEGRKRKKEGRKQRIHSCSSKRFFIGHFLGP